jgi:hypothetical protein
MHDDEVAESVPPTFRRIQIWARTANWHRTHVGSFPPSADSLASDWMDTVLDTYLGSNPAEVTDLPLTLTIRVS